MKQLFTLCLALMSVTAMAQWPTLPYNPDENGDGLIGVVDLAALLAQYNTEFASAVVSEDGESAIVYMGEMGYPQCEYSCSQLPGIWRLPNLVDLVPVWSEVYTTYSNIYTWVKADMNHFPGGNNGYTHYYPYFWSKAGNGPGDHIVQMSDRLTYSYRCYCAAKQLPRVEYDYCYGVSGSSGYGTGTNESLNQLKECVNEKLELGWQLLGTTQAVSSNYRHVQALWRLAE